MILNILLTFGILLGIFAIYMIWRNEMVCRYRIKLINKCNPRDPKQFDRQWAVYESYPSNDTMFNKFWIWPLSKFEGQA